MYFCKMKNLTLTIALVLSQILLFAQCPPGDLIFSSQAQVDDFGISYPNCNEFPGGITITGNVLNLNGLSGLTSIGGDLNFLYNVQLSNMTGLTNLTSVGGNVSIIENYTMISLVGLNSLSTIGGYLYINRNNMLISVSGLNSLTSVGDGLSISESASLTNVGGLNSLTYVGTAFEIFNCPSLSSLSGLENLASIDGYCKIENNDALTSIAGFEGLTSIGGELSIRSNYVLTSLSGLDNVDAESINGLSIYSNFLLSSCEVLSICNYLANPGGSILISNNATGCKTQEEVETACEWVSVGELNPASAFSIYPNPGTSSITLETPKLNHDATLTITQTNGQELISRQIKEIKTTIDISHLTAGMYIVRLQSSKGIAIQKLVVNK